MKTSLLVVLVLSLLCIGAQPQPEPVQVKWRPAPHKAGDIAMDGDWLIFPKTDIYEVVPSRMGSSSVRDLPETGFKELTEVQARSVTGHYYTCSSGKRPFLVRAVYAPDGSGGFGVDRKGNSLAVIWGSMPGLSRGDLQQSALVVNLDFTPDEIYNEESGIPSMP